jgi:acyl-CoA-binding protein
MSAWARLKGLAKQSALYKYIVESIDFASNHSKYKKHENSYPMEYQPQANL